jgi:hypothetical protein
MSEKPQNASNSIREISVKLRANGKIEECERADVGGWVKSCINSHILDAIVRTFLAGTKF